MTTLIVILVLVAFFAAAGSVGTRRMIGPPTIGPRPRRDAK